MKFLKVSMFIFLTIGLSSLFALAPRSFEANFLGNTIRVTEIDTGGGGYDWCVIFINGHLFWEGSCGINGDDDPEPLAGIYNNSDYEYSTGSFFDEDCDGNGGKEIELYITRKIDAVLVGVWDLGCGEANLEYQPTSFSTISSIKSTQNKFQKFIQSESEINIKLESNIDRFFVFDNSGKIIYSISRVDSNTATIDISEYASGIYYLVAKSMDNHMYSQKFNIIK